MTPAQIEYRKNELLRHLKDDDLTPNYEKLMELRKYPELFEKRKRVD
jgi:hypothetical protein